jgi:hypothetical protein
LRREGTYGECITQAATKARKRRRRGRRIGIEWKVRRMRRRGAQLSMWKIWIQRKRREEDMEGGHGRHGTTGATDNGAAWEEHDDLVQKMTTKGFFF